LGAVTRAVLAATGVALVVGCGGASGPAAREPGPIVFVWSPEERLDRQALYIAEIDGTGRRQMTPLDGSVPSEAEWAPDGIRIAYVLSTDCPKRGGEIPPSCFAIWTVNADGGGRRALVPPSLHFDYLGPTWSPDGEQIAYVRQDENGDNVELWVMNDDGSGKHRLAEGSVSDPAWSPNGDLILFSGFAEGRSFPESDLFTVTVDDGEVRQLTQTPTDGEEVPDWSPDGERIAYERLISGEGAVAYQVWVMDADGTNQRILSDPEAAFDGGPVWSPDGQKLVFSSERDGTETNLVVDVDDWKPRPLDAVPYGIWDWGPRPS
jgi:Tol biopolymer transport system component